MKNIKRGKHDSKCPFCKHLEMQQADQPVGKEASGPLLPLFNKCFLKTVRWGGSRGVITISFNSDKNSSIHQFFRVAINTIPKAERLKNRPEDQEQGAGWVALPLRLQGGISSQFLLLPGDCRHSSTSGHNSLQASHCLLLCVTFLCLSKDTQYDSFEARGKQKLCKWSS